MIACNTVLLGKHYFLRFPSFAALCVARLLYETLGILIVEDNRRRKLGALVQRRARWNAGAICVDFGRLLSSCRHLLLAVAAGLFGIEVSSRDDLNYLAELEERAPIGATLDALSWFFLSVTSAQLVCPA